MLVSVTITHSIQLINFHNDVDEFWKIIKQMFQGIFENSCYVSYPCHKVLMFSERCFHGEILSVENKLKAFGIRTKMFVNYLRSHRKDTQKA